MFVDLLWILSHVEMHTNDRAAGLNITKVCILPNAKLELPSCSAQMCLVSRGGEVVCAKILQQNQDCQQCTDV